MDTDFESRLNALIAASDGRIWIESGDRDTATQQRLWDEAVAKYGPDEARNWVAPPGHSYHEKGMAADLGYADYDAQRWAHQHAAEFGLWFPMPDDDWEPWHVEPLGSRGGQDDPLSYTARDRDPSALVRGPVQQDYGESLARLLGIQPFGGPNNAQELIFQQGGADAVVSANPGFRGKDPADELPTPGRTEVVPGAGTRRSANADIDRFMNVIREIESSGNYIAVGRPTRWGTAKGAYQFLDSTWDNYGGYATADQAPPEVQDERARQLMQSYYDQFGSWDAVAAAWFSGPGGNWESSEVQQYVAKVNSRL